MRLLGVDFAEPDPELTPSAVAAAFSGPPGLYIHVPFCRTICPFCPYNKVRFRSELAARYLDDLERETSLHLAEHSGPFPSLYVGGGTPTLCLDGMEPLLNRLDIAGERAIEVLPTHMTTPTARHLGALGFDYVSLGVQSFDAGVLRRLRRPGSPTINRAAVETAVEHFTCVDVDLIFDSACDDPRTLLDDLTLCFEYGVEQVSTYPLMRFGFTPFGKSAHSPDLEHMLLRDAAALAGSLGYERRSVWTFNRVGAPTYTSITRPYYLGLGAGSATFTGRLFLVNHFGLDQYGKAVRSGHLPVARAAHLSRPAAAAYRSFWQAYTGRLASRDVDPLLRHPVARMARTMARVAGWSRQVDGEWVLTESGYDRFHDLERWVTYRLIEPLWAGMIQEHESCATAPVPQAGGVA